MKKHMEPQINDLIYMFDFQDGLIVQQLLIALKNGYEVKTINSAKGCFEIVLSYVGVRDA